MSAFCLLNSQRENSQREDGIQRMIGSTTASMTQDLQGAGLGLRRGMINELSDYLAKHPQAISFLEVAPENWIGLGGRFARQLRALTEQYPLTLHGLSLNVGGFSPLGPR